MTFNHPIVDSGKRHTLKRLIGTAGATATLVSLPALANANLNNEHNTIHVGQISQTGSGKIAIDATLVSIPGTINETFYSKT